VVDFLIQNGANIEVKDTDILIWDLPGCGTTTEQEGMSGNDYMRHYSLNSFDILICAYNQRESKLLLDIYEEFCDKQVHLFFVRCQLDLDLDVIFNDNDNDECIEKTMSKRLGKLETIRVGSSLCLQPLLKDHYIYFTCNSYEYDYLDVPKLVDDILRTIYNNTCHLSDRNSVSVAKLCQKLKKQTQLFRNSEQYRDYKLEKLLEIQFEDDCTNNIVLDLHKHGTNSVDILNEINNRITETISHLDVKKSIDNLRNIRDEYDHIVADELRTNIEQLFDKKITKPLKILVVNPVTENKDVYYNGLLKKKEYISLTIIVQDT